MSAIYDNAVDSLRIGFEFFQEESSCSSRKHAILTVFHAIELFFKEHLSQINPVLIYKNMDARITDDSQTVGIREILVRFENVGLKLPPEQIEAIGKIQKIRNRIEHHRYDHNEEEDELVIAQALKVILYFTEFVLGRKIGDDIGADMHSAMNRRVLDYNEREGMARYRLEEWMKKEWPDWNPMERDCDEFGGTFDCPVWRQSYLAIGYHDKPFCFHCNAEVDAANCEDCGRTYLVSEGCCTAEE
ncbi:hypothetical protein AB8Z38_30515 [Bradyrhizobium sp. LLZ17]|uniref:HEPN AbiU2-like domain-containing protein n=1 Tax=Bradyrhizobium sp. LLZ17 TaxID=3239388 RepID=A0AB39XKK4_9BRAD